MPCLHLQSISNSTDSRILFLEFGPGNAPNVVDALSASGLAGVKNAPILLSHPTSLQKDTIEAIEGMDAVHAYIVGGEGAISSDVESGIQALGLSTSRIREEGGDRFSTAGEVAKDVLDLNGSKTVIVAGGTALVDSLVAGPVAYQFGYPILLVGRSVPEATERILIEYGIEDVIIIGGSGVVSDSVEQRLTSIVNGTVTRVAGANRFETSLAIANQFFSDHRKAILVNGVSFVDAVPASTLGAPILYTRENRLLEGVEALLFGKETFSVVGGPGVLSDEVLYYAYQAVFQ